MGIGAGVVHQHHDAGPKATVTAITVAAVAGAFAVLWYALPLLRLRGRDGDDASA